jgi:hypothetical protein
MHLLYYWRGDNYRRDLDFGVGFHLNQSNERLHSVETGESVWAFTRRPDGRYALAVELVVSAKTLNPTRFRYGRYRVWGDLRRSRYFQVEGQPDFSHLVRATTVRAVADVIGRSFQGHAAVRGLEPMDHDRLLAYASNLPLEPRARLLPEERLEALLLAGDEHSVARLIRHEPSGLAARRRAYLLRSAATRDRSLSADLRDLYDGRCQVCSWAPRGRYAVELCEAHHVRWLSRGGSDALWNLLLLCPNHHRAIHGCDAPYDFEKLGFVFPNHFEPLTDSRHELRAE